MQFKSIHQLIPFGKLFRFLIGFSIIIQLAIILYNHFSGYHILVSFEYFLFRLARGFILSLITGFLLAYPNLFMVIYLNIIKPWSQKTLSRIFIELVFIIVLAIIISLIITITVNTLSAYEEDFYGVIISNMLIFCVINIFMMAILEAWIFYVEKKQAENLAKNLNKELSQIKFEVLKSQINPHFMFNSLNVLSSLISKDINKAQDFIDEFSSIYRYVLETIEKPFSTLESELDFMRSYLFLQQIRYGNHLSYSINVSGHLIKYVLPPLSLQVVLENAIKHNIINKSNPLKIEVFSQSEYLVVKNNIQLKTTIGNSTGLGLKNIIKRYKLIGNKKPVFSVETNHYIVKLPLIEIEKDERSNY